MGGRGAGFERRCDTHELIPLFDDRNHIGIAGEQASKQIRDLTVVATPESLIRQILETRHEVDAKKIAQTPQGLGKSMRIGGMHLGVDAGVVVKNAGEHIGGFPRSAGDDR
jgi:hypothetical protein